MGLCTGHLITLLHQLCLYNTTYFLIYLQLFISTKHGMLILVSISPTSTNAATVYASTLSYSKHPSHCLGIQYIFPQFLVYCHVIVHTHLLSLFIFPSPCVLVDKFMLKK